MKIHLVIGATSEYDNYAEWVVCAVVDENQAKEHARKATDRAKEIFDHMENLGWYNCDREKICKTNEFDPKMYMDHPGTKYFVKSTEISTPIEIKYMGLKLLFNKILRFLRLK